MKPVVVLCAVGVVVLCAICVGYVLPQLPCRIVLADESSSNNDNSSQATESSVNVSESQVRVVWTITSLTRTDMAWADVKMHVSLNGRTLREGTEYTLITPSAQYLVVGQRICLRIYREAVAVTSGDIVELKLIYVSTRSAMGSFEVVLGEV